jgi:hypothetical protein
MATSMTAVSRMQERVFAYLTDPATHPLVRRIDKHAAQRAVRILSQGQSVVADSVFAATMERAAIRGAARKLSIGFVGLFLVTELATRLNRVGHQEANASDPTPEIAGLHEKYNIGAVDWGIIDAFGTPPADFKAMQNPGRSFWGGSGPIAQNSNVAIPEISQ